MERKAHIFKKCAFGHLTVVISAVLLLHAVDKQVGLRQLQPRVTSHLHAASCQNPEHQQFNSQLSVLWNRRLISQLSISWTSTSILHHRSVSWISTAYLVAVNTLIIKDISEQPASWTTTAYLAAGSTPNISNLSHSSSKMCGVHTYMTAAITLNMIACLTAAVNPNMRAYLTAVVTLHWEHIWQLRNPEYESTSDSCPNPEYESISGSCVALNMTAYLTASVTLNMRAYLTAA